MNIKSSKSRSISLAKGKSIDKRLYVDVEEIPSIIDKPVKSVGRWYNREMNAIEQLQQLMKEGIGRIERSGLPGEDEVVMFAVWFIP